MWIMNRMKEVFYSKERQTGWTTIDLALFIILQYTKVQDLL